MVDRDDGYLSSRALFERGLNNCLTTSDHIVYVEEGKIVRSRDVLNTFTNIADHFDMLPHKGFIGCSVHSPSLILCSLLASWRTGHVPLLLDPSLKDELSSLIKTYDIQMIVSDTHIAHPHYFIDIQSCQADIEYPHPADLVIPMEEDIAVAFFTSGSEGVGKLVFKKGRQIYEELSVLRAFFSLKDGMSFLSFVPPFHIYGFLIGELLPILCGGCAYIESDPILLAIAREISRVKPALVVGSPLHYKALMREGRLQKDPEKVIYLSSGAPLSPELSFEFQQVTGMVIYQIYGSTETGGIACRVHNDIWQPLPRVSITIDPVDSIIEVQSPWASELGRESKARTMDAGEPVDGGFKLLGRAGTLLKLRGKRFSTLEVENMVRSYPGIDDAVVFALTVDDIEYLVGFFTCIEDTNIHERDVWKYLKQHLASFKIPRFITHVASIPRIKLGKADYNELRRLALEFFRDEILRDREFVGHNLTSENPFT